MERKKPETWSIKEVGDWLGSIGLAQYKEKFEELGIDGSLLFEAKEDDLKNDLEITIRLHRVKIIQEISKLSELASQNFMNLERNGSEEDID